MKPWEWDHDNYEGTEEKESMYGRFYDEDLENIKQIDEMIARHREREEKKQQSQQRRAAMRKH